MKRLFGVLLALAMLCACLGTASGENETADIKTIIWRIPWVGAYTGELDNGQPAGSGVFEGVYAYDDDSLTTHYDGQWRDGVPDGQGAFVYRLDGESLLSYEGEWVHGLPEGQGKGITLQDGVVQVYEGGWKEGCHYGEGRLSSGDGEVLAEGLFVLSRNVDAFLSDAVSEYFSAYGIPPVNEQTRNFIEDNIFGLFDDYGMIDYDIDPESLHFNAGEYLEDPSSFAPRLVRLPIDEIQDKQREDSTSYDMLQILFTDTDGQAYCGLMRGDDSYLSYADVMYALPLGAADIDGETHIMCLLMNDWNTLYYAVEEGQEFSDAEGEIDITLQICRQTWTGTYMGQLYADRPSGNGIFWGVGASDESTIYYDGKWRQGVPEGQGTATYYTGGAIDEHYEGEWRNGSRYGQGVVSDGSGEITYEGLVDGADYVEALWPDVAVTVGDVLGDDVKQDYRDFIEEHVFDIFSVKHTDPISDDLLISDFDPDQFLSDPRSYEPGLVPVSGSFMESITMDYYMGYHVAEIAMYDSIHRYVCLMRWDDTNKGSVGTETLYVLPLGVMDAEGETYIVGICVNNLRERSLKEGDTGEIVLLMKQRMQELGYFSAGASLSDSYNATCTERVRQFQKVNGLEQTGIADAETQQLLYSEYAKPKP